MPSVRSTTDPFELVNHTGRINLIPNVSNFVKGMNLFSPSFTHLTTQEVDRVSYTHKLPSQVNRNGGKPTTRDKNNVDKYVLRIPYFHDVESIYTSDWVGKVVPGTGNQEETKASVTAERLQQVKWTIDELHEYMFLQAIKGVTKSPDGVTVADMFTLFGETQDTFDFDLGTSTVDVGAKCRQLRTLVQQNLKTGGALSGALMVLVSPTFFDKLVKHTSVIQAFLNYGASARYQNAMDMFQPWGITAFFEFAGVMFVTYDHEFPLADGTTEKAIEDDEGWTVPRVGGESVLKVVYGGSRREGATGGAEIHAFEYQDPRQMFTEIHHETAPLPYTTRPKTSVKVITST